MEQKNFIPDWQKFNEDLEQPVMHSPDPVVPSSPMRFEYGKDGELFFYVGKDAKPIELGSDDEVLMNLIDAKYPDPEDFEKGFDEFVEELEAAPENIPDPIRKRIAEIYAQQREQQSQEQGAIN